MNVLKASTLMIEILQSHNLVPSKLETNISLNDDDSTSISQSLFFTKDLELSSVIDYITEKFNLVYLSCEYITDENEVEDEQVTHQHLYLSYTSLKESKVLASPTNVFHTVDAQINNQHPIYVTNDSDYYFKIQCCIDVSKLKGCTLHNSLIDMQKYVCDALQCDMEEIDDCEIIINREQIEICQGRTNGIVIEKVEQYISDFTM